MVSIVVCNGAAEDAASGMEPMEASSGAIWRLIGCVPLAASSPGRPRLARLVLRDGADRVNGARHGSRYVEMASLSTMM